MEAEGEWGSLPSHTLVTGSGTMISALALGNNQIEQISEFSMSGGGKGSGDPE